MSEIGKGIDRVAAAALGSLLKEAGFRKTGRTWRRATPSNVIHVINVQAATTNVGGEGRCTLNTGVYVPALAERLNIFPVTASPSEADCHLRIRPAMLAPGNRDTWYDVDVTSVDSVASAASELRQGYALYGQPWLDQHSDLRSVRDALVRQGTNWWAAAASLLLEDHDDARSLLARAMSTTSPNGAARLCVWGASNGLL